MPYIVNESILNESRRAADRIMVEAGTMNPAAALPFFEPSNPDTPRLQTADEQFRGSDEVFHLMVNNIKDYGIIMLDTEGRIVTWNIGAQAICGYASHEVMGKHYSLCHIADDIREGKAEQELAAANATGSHAVEAWRVQKDGTLFWANIVLTALRDPAGKLLGFAMVTRDMSERKRAEIDLAANTADLIAANKELEAFAYAVSHDLRAPLRHLDGFADLLRASCYQQLNAQDQRYLNKITASAQRMGILIDELLTFSRLLRADVSRTKVNLRLLQEEVRRELEPDLAGRNVVWIIGELPEVYGDRSMLRQVFVNLLLNAVKYTRDCSEARIEIGCDGSSGNMTTIFVRDNGVGFEMDYVHKLFEVFQRLHSGEFEGTGVGLAIVRRIVERHGGRVWGEGQVNHGAKFSFSLQLDRNNSNA